MTSYLDHAGGRISYHAAGDGPLVLLGHGLGDNRNAFRALGPALIEAGYRVAAFDLRGHGQSSVGWPSYTRTDIAGDMAALIRHLGGGPALVIGHSYAGGAAVILAATQPELVTAIVLIGPGTRKPSLRIGDLNGRFVKGMSLIAGTALLRSRRVWSAYLGHAFPGTRNENFELGRGALLANLGEPGRMTAVVKMISSSPGDAQVKLPSVQRPALVVMGTLDPDFPSPASEAKAIVAEMPPGVGGVAMIEGAGHYPHTQFPDEVARVVLPFLSARSRA